MYLDEMHINNVMDKDKNKVSNLKQKLISSFKYLLQKSYLIDKKNYL